MGVRLRSLRRWTKSRIPFECNNDWALKRIEDFNRAIKKTLFITRRFNQSNYVVIKPGQPQSNIGMMVGGQTLNYKANDPYSFFHEMGHCVGLGHEYFHPSWPLRDDLLGICACDTYVKMARCPHGLGFDRRAIHKEAYLISVGKYIHSGNFDARSIMSYNPNLMGMNGIPYNQPQKLSAGDISLIRSLYPGALA